MGGQISTEQTGQPYCSWGSERASSFSKVWPLREVTRGHQEGTACPHSLKPRPLAHYTKLLATFTYGPGETGQQFWKPWPSQTHHWHILQVQGAAWSSQEAGPPVVSHDCHVTTVRVVRSCSRIQPFLPSKWPGRTHGPRWGNEHIRMDLSLRNESRQLTWESRWKFICLQQP